MRHPVLVLILPGVLAVACSGITVEHETPDAGGAVPDAGTFACGAGTCNGDALCVHPCCYDSPACQPYADGGGCPDGSQLGYCSQGMGCVPPPCTPGPPFCAPRAEQNCGDGGACSPNACGDQAQLQGSDLSCMCY